MTRTSKIAAGLFFGLVFSLLYFPIGVLMVNSVNSFRFGHRWGGFTWEWYSRLFQNEQLLNAFFNSLKVGVVAATVATLVGTLMAFALYRYQFRGKTLASGALFMVMMSPDIVLAITFLLIFIFLGISLGFWSLLIAHATFCLPFVVITVYARLRGLDNNLLEAAQDLGASPWQSFRLVILPLILPAVVSGWLLSFTLSMDDVIVSSFVTGPGYEILPIRVYSLVRVGVSPEVNALATLLLLASLTLVLLTQLFFWRRAK